MPTRAAKKTTEPKGNGLGPVSNDAEEQILSSAPYMVDVEITGNAALLFHRWSVEAVAEKAAASKGSKSKKTDDLESYVYRDDKGYLCLPLEYVRMSMCYAAKYRQDPRSPRKSAMDLFRAAVVPVDELATLGKKDWDFVDQRRVQVQRSGITRSRPALHSGWACKMRFQVVLPEYVPVVLFHEVLTDAGRFVGVGDFRPTYGRFNVTSCRQVILR